MVIKAGDGQMMEIKMKEKGGGNTANKESIDTGDIRIHILRVRKTSLPQIEKEAALYRLIKQVVLCSELHPLKWEKEKVKNLLKICKIKEEERAERLSLKDWVKLTKEFLKMK